MGHKPVNKCFMNVLQYLQSIVTAIADMDCGAKKLKNFHVFSHKNIHLNHVHDAQRTFEEALYAMAESTVRVLSSFVLMNRKGD